MSPRRGCCRSSTVGARCATLSLSSARSTLLASARPRSPPYAGSSSSASSFPPSRPARLRRQEDPPSGGRLTGHVRRDRPAVEDARLPQAAKVVAHVEADGRVVAGGVERAAREADDALLREEELV